MKGHCDELQFGKESTSVRTIHVPLRRPLFHDFRQF